MANLTIRSVLNIVRTFLDEIKKTNFFFDVISVDLIEGEWEVECEVANHNDDEGFEYVIRVDDASGEVTYIAKAEDEDMEEEGEEEGEPISGDGMPPPPGGDMGYGGM